MLALLLLTIGAIPGYDEDGKPIPAVVVQEVPDTRQEVWMFVDPNPGCLPCEKAKRELLGADCPLRIVVKESIPDDVRSYVTSYPTFYWTLDTTSNKRFHRGYTDRQSLLDAFEASRREPDEAPTPDEEIERVIRILPKPELRFIEFGCGSDARWCVAAVRRWGCQATGIEINSARATKARNRVKSLGLDSLITIVDGDAVTTDVQADVGAAYLYSDVLTKLRPRVQKLRSFASYIHQPPGLTVTQNGDSWIYTQPQPVRVDIQQIQPAKTPMAVWNGWTYTAPVCNNPRCQMCNSIRQQLMQGK